MIAKPFRCRSLTGVLVGVTLLPERFSEALEELFAVKTYAGFEGFKRKVVATAG